MARGGFVCACVKLRRFRGNFFFIFLFSFLFPVFLPKTKTLFSVSKQRSVANDTKHVNHARTFIKDRDFRSCKSFQEFSSSCVKVFNGRKLMAPLDDLRLWGDLTRRGASTRRPLPVKGLRRRRQEDVAGEKKFSRKREICFSGWN